MLERLKSHFDSLQLIACEDVSNSDLLFMTTTNGDSRDALDAGVFRTARIDSGDVLILG